MAKVITPPPEQPLDQRATCKRCECQFSYGKHEIHRKNHCLDGGWSGTGIEYIVKCPNCEYEQVVGRDFIPPNKTMCDPLDKLRQDIAKAADKKVLVTMPDSLEQFTDQKLRDELKRRVAARKAANAVLRCRDCKHCGEGHCNKRSRWYKTSVCFRKPKPQAGPDCYYATLHSRKACDKFEPK